MHTKEALSSSAEKAILNLLKRNAKGFTRSAIRSHGLAGAGIGAIGGGLNAARHQFSGDYEGMSSREKLNQYLANMGEFGALGAGVGALHGGVSGRALKNGLTAKQLQSMTPHIEEALARGRSEADILKHIEKNVDPLTFAGQAKAKIDAGMGSWADKLHGEDMAKADELGDLEKAFAGKSVNKAVEGLVPATKRDLSAAVGAEEAVSKVVKPTASPVVQQPEYSKEISDLVGLRTLQGGLTKQQHQRLAELLHKQTNGGGIGQAAKEEAAALRQRYTTADGRTAGPRRQAAEQEAAKIEKDIEQRMAAKPAKRKLVPDRIEDAYKVHIENAPAMEAAARKAQQEAAAFQKTMNQSHEIPNEYVGDARRAWAEQQAAKAVANSTASGGAAEKLDNLVASRMSDLPPNAGPGGQVFQQAKGSAGKTPEFADASPSGVGPHINSIAEQEAAGGRLADMVQKQREAVTQPGTIGRQAMQFNR